MSSCVTLAAPCRCATPRQSAAVVAAANDDHVLAGGVDRRAFRLAGDHLVRGNQVAPSRGVRRRGSRPGVSGTSRPSSAPQASSTASYSSRSPATVTSRPTSTPVRKLDAFGRHLGDPALDVDFLELEVGDAVAQQPARLGIALVDGDRVPGPYELLGSGETGRTGADHGYRLAAVGVRRLRRDVPGGRTHG